MAEPIDVEHLVVTLTLEQKAALLSGLDSWHTEPLTEPRVPAIRMSDGPHGVRREFAPGRSIPATAFPTGSALGATWDRDLVRRVGEALGIEAAAQGVSVLLGPGVNIKRTPLCGRNFEYLAEDPFLAGELAVAYVAGVQSRGVGTSLKHLAANNQEWGRFWFSSDVDERTLREIYLPAFERVVTRAKPWTVMCAYNRVNGVHASQHRWLLTDVLRGEWGYEGLVVSDWGAVHDRVAALKAGLDLEMPGGDGTTDAKIVAAVRAGELPEDAVDRSVRRVLELVAKGTPVDDPQVLTWGEAEVTDDVGNPVVAARPDEAAADREAADPAVAGPALPTDLIEAHHALAREAAAASITLLSNDGVLPLASDVGRIALIGPYAAAPHIQGGGSARVNPTRTPSALAAVRALHPDVVYVPGYPNDARTTADGAAPDGTTVRATAADGTDPAPALAADATTASDPAAEAVAAARAGDVAVVFVAQHELAESEGYDRRDLELPEEQTRVLAAVIATGTPVVVVLTCGSAVLLDARCDGAAAVVHAGFSGQGVGEALADVLFGVVNPSGRLTETWPMRIADTPAYATYPGERGAVRYGEGVFVGYRWYDEMDRPVRYPFGHGLSFTEFVYTDLTAEAAAVTESARAAEAAEITEDAEVTGSADVVRLACTVTNTGPVAGAEVVQVYVAPPRRTGGVSPEAGPSAESCPTTPVRRPVRELKGFAKVWLAPGESRRVEFGLQPRDLAYYDVADGLWRREAGEYRIDVGASSRDIRISTVVTLEASPVGPAAPTDRDLEARVLRASAVCPIP